MVQSARFLIIKFTENTLIPKNYRNTGHSLYRSFPIKLFGSPGTCLNQVSLVIDKPKPRNAEAEKNLKKAEFNFMVDLKTLIHETSVDPKLLQLKICLLNNELPKNFLRFSVNLPNDSTVFAVDEIFIPE